ETCADIDRNHDAGVVDANPPAVKQRWRIGRVIASVRPGTWNGSEREDAAIFEEEFPLLREDQVEASQIHLLFVDLDLREVRVHGGVSGQVRRDAVPRVNPEVALRVIVDNGRGQTIAGDA